MIDTTCYITLHYITLKICSLPQVLFGEKVLCHSCSQPFWWQMFCCSWTTYLDQLPASLWDKKSAVQNSEDNTENIHVSDGLRRIVTFLIIAPMRLINTLTYLFTYLPLTACSHSIQFTVPYRLKSGTLFRSFHNCIPPNTEGRTVEVVLRISPLSIEISFLPSFLTYLLPLGHIGDTVGYVIWPVKPSPKWPIMCRVGDYTLRYYSVYNVSSGTLYPTILQRASGDRTRHRQWTAYVTMGHSTLYSAPTTVVSVTASLWLVHF